MLCGKDREPEPALGDDLACGGPHLAHLRRGVPVGQHVADLHCSAHRQPASRRRDVAAVEGALELNLSDRLIRPAASCLDIITEPDDGKHPTPGADEVALLIK